MRISTRGFKEAVERFQQMADAPQRQQEFRRVLVDALEPIRAEAARNVHSITGRTVDALTVAAGASPTYPSAYLKIDRNIAFAMWRGKKFPYPFAVEAGHGGKHPAEAHPWFRPAFDSKRAVTRQMVRDGIEQFLHPYVTSLSVGGEFL